MYQCRPKNFLIKNVKIICFILVLLTSAGYYNEIDICHPYVRNWYPLANPDKAAALCLTSVPLCFLVYIAYFSLLYKKQEGDNISSNEFSFVYKCFAFLLIILSLVMIIHPWLYDLSDYHVHYLQEVKHKYSAGRQVRENYEFLKNILLWTWYPWFPNSFLIILFDLLAINICAKHYASIDNTNVLEADELEPLSKETLSDKNAIDEEK